MSLQTDHGLWRTLPISVPQLKPIYPDGQLHEKYGQSLSTAQVAPFKHALREQGSAVKKKTNKNQHQVNVPKGEWTDDLVFILKFFLKEFSKVKTDL